MSFKFSFIEAVGDLRPIPWSDGSSMKGFFLNWIISALQRC